MSSNSSIEKALALRQKNRTANSAKKRAEADRLKNEGNDMFKDTNYVGASRRYVQATKLVGHTPVLMSNLAAAHLKLEQYKIAEWAATVALLYDPHMTKARYRRGVARTEQAELEAAYADFETVLIEDPHCTEANDRMGGIQGLWDEVEECLEDGVLEGKTPGPLLGMALEEAVKPDFDDDPWELSSVDSDSSDCQHVGNGVPCRFYNSPNGCTRGGSCRFSHAPDGKSVRDRLGRNVCICYLFDSCRFGNTCNYSHSKAYLKAGQWDNPGDEDQLMEYEAMIRQVAKIKKFTQKLYQIAPTSPIPEIKTWKWPGKRTPVITETPRRVVSAANRNRFVLLLSFEHGDSFARIHTHLMLMLNSPDLAGVFVTDPGAARRCNKKVSIKLVEYANAGGTVVIGGLFSTFIATGEFNSFFRAWGLPWTQGSYHRTTFSLNRSHEMAGRNPSLVPKYSMKAVHVANIRQGDAVYTPTDGSRLESLVFAPIPITNLSEPPVVHTRVGSGHLGYIGDVNAEDASTNTMLAMLGLLDAPHTPEPTTTLAPQPKKMTIPPTPFVLILSFDSVKYVKTYYSDFISRMKQEIEVIHGLSNSRVMELISSPDLIGILIMDSPIADAENAPVLEKVVEFAKRGGKVVLGGLFPGGMAPDEMKAFFATSWDLPWEMSDYTSAEMIVNAEHPIVGQYKPKSLDPTYHAKSVFLSGIKSNMVVYKAMTESYARSSRSNVKAAIVHTQVGKGHLGFIGDVNPGPEVTEVMLAMLGLNDLVNVH